MHEGPWRDYAACWDVDEERRSWFFGDDEEGDSTQAMRLHRQAQLQFCFQCPVQVPCLAEGIETDATGGVWGGLTFSQRKRIAKPLIAHLGYNEVVLQMAIDRVRTNLGA